MKPLVFDVGAFFVGARNYEDFEYGKRNAGFFGVLEE
jgi:hypothetical protein